MPCKTNTEHFYRTWNTWALCMWFSDFAIELKHSLSKLELIKARKLMLGFHCLHHFENQKLTLFWLIHFLGHVIMSLTGHQHENNNNKCQCYMGWVLYLCTNQEFISLEICNMAPKYSSCWSNCALNNYEPFFDLR